ncbi:MAG: glutamine synthetase family protein [Candidatus Jordarchaeales archaeon]
MKSDVLEEAKEKALRIVREKDVDLVLLKFVDIMGTPKTCTIPVKKFEDALNEGIGFDGSSIEGFVRIYESDMRLIPDPTSLRILPRITMDKKVALIFCDVYRPEGRPFDGDPRYVLKKNLEEAEKMGFSYCVGPELEFFLFRAENGVVLEPQDHGGYFDLAPLDLAFNVRAEAMQALQEMGIEVEMGHHEVSPGQHEIDFRYGDALTIADAVMIYKFVVKSVAKRHGLFASFMPKPFFGMNGSGMHVHQSLWRDGRNIFFDPKDKYNLSDIAYYFIGGQLKYIKEIIVVLAPTVNSYKRLVPGYEAPVYISWARRNRSALIRIPEYFVGREKSMRAELRCPDPSCNPYLAFSVMLKAALEGIKHKIEPPEPIEEDIYHFDDAKLKELYIDTLPGSLGEAIEYASKSKLLKEALGEHVYTKYLEAKRREWEEFRTAVTDWEIKKYLPIL